jgi:hypothetical protein
VGFVIPIEIRGQEKFEQWVMENGVEYFENYMWCISPSHKNYTGIDKQGRCYHIEVYGLEDRYIVLQVDWKNALRSLEYSGHEWDFEQLLQNLSRS